MEYLLKRGAVNPVHDKTRRSGEFPRELWTALVLILAGPVLLVDALLENPSLLEAGIAALIEALVAAVCSGGGTPSASGSDAIPSCGRRSTGGHTAENQRPGRAVSMASLSSPGSKARNR